MPQNHIYVKANNINLPPGCTSRADLVFLIDSSTSVGEANFQKMLRYVITIIQEIRISSRDFRVGIATYSSSATIHIQLDTYERKDELLFAIMRIPYNYGSTNTPGKQEVLVISF